MEEDIHSTFRRQSDHDLLIEVRVKLEDLHAKVDKLTDDHENRIRSLEIWKWISIGLGTAGGAGLSELFHRLIN